MAYRKWQDAAASQAVDRGHAERQYKNIAVAIGPYADAVVKAFNANEKEMTALAAQNISLASELKKLKAGDAPAEENALDTAPPEGWSIKTSILPGKGKKSAAAGKEITEE